MRIKRQVARWQINWLAKIKLCSEEKILSCKILDISFKGIKLVLTDKLPRDNLLKVNIFLSEEFVLDLELWRVWHKTIDGHYLYGFYFVRIKEADKEKIYQFMSKYCPQTISRHWWQTEIEEKGGEYMNDRRIFARFPAQLPLRYLDISSNQEGEAQTFDLSAKGIGLVTQQQLPEYTPLEIWLRMPVDGKPLYLKGQVVWSKDFEPQGYRVGVELEETQMMSFSQLLGMV